MPEEKESISITMLSTSSVEYWYPFVWSETKILWVPMFFYSNSKTIQILQKPNPQRQNQPIYQGAYDRKIEVPK